MVRGTLSFMTVLDLVYCDKPYLKFNGRIKQRHMSKYVRWVLTKHVLNGSVVCVQCGARMHFGSDFVWHHISTLKAFNVSDWLLPSERERRIEAFSRLHHEIRRRTKVMCRRCHWFEHGHGNRLRVLSRIKKQ